MIEDEEIEYTLNTLEEQPDEQIGTIEEQPEEQISTISEDIYTIGVESLNGQAGHLTLKNINGTDLVGEGDLSLATSSALQSEAEAREQADTTLQNHIDAKQDQLTAGANIQINGSVISATDTTYTAGDNIQINGTTISATDTTYTAGNGLDLTGTEFSVDTSVIATQSDITNLQNTKQDNLTETQLDAVNSGIDSTKVEQIATNKTDIDTIEGKIPNQASSLNQLADKAFVNSSVQTATANFRGNWEDWGSVPSNAEDYPADYAGSKTPTVNDYLVVQDASDYTGDTLEGTWRFKYSGTWATDGKSGWLPEYQVNETPLTAAQLAALNSGITDTLVAQIGTNTTDIANKLDKTTTFWGQTAQNGAVQGTITLTESGQTATIAASGHNTTDAGIKMGNTKNYVEAGVATTSIVSNTGNVVISPASGAVVNMSNRRVAQVATPTADADATNKKYVDDGLATKQNTLTAGTNINIDSNVISTQTRGVEYIVGTQTAATNVWTGVSTDKGCSNGTLYVGKTIVYYLPQAGNSSAATLTLALPDGTATSAIALRRASTGTVTTHYAAGNAIFMTYDGTYWKTSAYYDSNTNTVSQLRAQNAFKAVTAITADTLCCGTSAGYIQLGAGSSFDITYPLLWQTAATTAGTTSTTFYYAIEGRTVRNNKSGWTGTTNQMVWLVGTLSGNTFTVDTDVFTQTIPTTEDGKVYAPIGIAYSAYQIYFKSPEQFWWFKSGEFRPVAQSEVAPAGFWSDPATITSTGTNLTLNNQLPVASKNVQIDGDTIQASDPTPESPQAVNVVTGNQVVEVMGKNLFNKNATPYRTGAEFYNQATGYTVQAATSADVSITPLDTGIQIDTTSSWKGAWLLTKVKPNTTYAINYHQTSENGGRSTIYMLDSTYTTLNRGLNISNNYTYTGSVTTPANAKYIAVAFGVQTAGSTSLTDFQIEEGTHTAYEPYGTNYEVNLGKNLFDKDNMSEMVGYYIDGNGSIVAGSSNYLTWLELKPNTTYTLSQSVRTLQTVRIGLFPSAITTSSTGTVVGTFLSGTDIKQTFTTTSTNYWLAWVYWNGSQPDSGTYTRDMCKNSVQVELGSTATTYSPYFTPIELTKIGDYQDYIWKDGDTWKVHKETGKVVLDGSETDWGIQNNVFRRLFADVRQGALGEEILVISDHFTGRATCYRGDIGNGKCAKIVGNNQQVAFRYDALNGDVSAWTTWLSTHNTTVYYVLATPTDTAIADETLISQLEALANSKLYRPQTNIISSGTPPNLDAILTVETFQNNWNGLSSYILEANS